MKRSIIMMATPLMTLLVFESGCSWVMHQRIPDKPANEGCGEQVECGLAPPIIDTVMTTAAVTGMGVFFGLSAASPSHCGEWLGCMSMEKDLYALGGAVFTLVAAVWGAATATGWVNYHNCRQYRATVTANETFKTGPELFHPTPAKLVNPNRISAFADAFPTSR
jgi:hypothetical protein